MPTIEAMTARNRILALSPETVAAFSDTPSTLGAGVRIRGIRGARWLQEAHRQLGGVL